MAGSRLCAPLGWPLNLFSCRILGAPAHVFTDLRGQTQLFQLQRPQVWLPDPSLSCALLPARAWLRAQEASKARSLKQSGMLHSDGSSNREQVAVVVPAFQFPEPQKWLALSSAFGLAAVPSLRALDKAQQGKRLFTFPDETTRGQWSTLAGGCGCRTRKVGRSF